MREDFLKKNSVFFGKWCYIESLGFFKLKGLLFNDKEKKISKQKISDFVDQNKNFLQNFDEFKIHFSSFPIFLILQSVFTGLP